ncbi:MAG: hypothetical protein H6757_02345 [Candidatus Omnitrophica bacterium]|nr:hypothetical protein [Candidatus Omnitrophota bacterium]
MSDLKQLPYLLSLLDDDSPVVQEGVIKALAEMGPGLHEEVKKQAITLNDKQRKIIAHVFEIHNRHWLKNIWKDWLKPANEKERLEAALSMIADFQTQRKSPVSTGILLDRLAEEFQRDYGYGDCLDLAEFLFETKGLRGATNDYYNPLNSNLMFVIQEKRGIPISLACCYILVGHRLGLDIEGCNLPGHFLAKIIDRDQPVLVDCFNGGRLLNEKALISMNPGSAQAIKQTIHTSPDAKTIMKRVLSNLTYAYEQAGQPEDGQLMTALLKEMELPDVDELLDGLEGLL